MTNLGEILDPRPGVLVDREHGLATGPRSACLHGCATWRSGGTLCCREHPWLCEHGNVARVCPLTHVVGATGHA